MKRGGVGNMGVRDRCAATRPPLTQETFATGGGTISKVWETHALCGGKVRDDGAVIMFSREQGSVEDGSDGVGAS